MWGDGQAELSGYDLIQPRYGQSRRGVAVTIFVTESFSNSARVKADPGKHPPSDEFPVMKLNLIKDYQTGIYDYNDMLSSFVALQEVNGAPAGHTTKVSFSSQEWCGHVFSQILFGPKAGRLTSHSYFDGEADQQRDLPLPSEATSEDSDLLWARGMSVPFLRPGESRRAEAAGSLAVSRARHQPVANVRRDLHREAKAMRVSVPAGTFEVLVSRITAPAETKTFYVETVPPHRVVKWESTSGEKAELIGSERLKYWQLNREGGEQALKKLGLSRRGVRMP